MTCRLFFAPFAKFVGPEFESRNDETVHDYRNNIYDQFAAITNESFFPQQVLTIRTVVNEKSALGKQMGQALCKYYYVVYCEYHQCRAPQPTLHFSWSFLYQPPSRAPKTASPYFLES